MAEEAALDLLRRLARDFNVRDARKLYQIAKREYSDQPVMNRARDALRGDVAWQVLAPKPRSLGKSAAEGLMTGSRFDRLLPEHKERSEVWPRGDRRLH